MMLPLTFYLGFTARDLTAHRTSLSCWGLSKTMAHQDFLSSMTFATASAGCSCDECGIPSEILEAIRKRKAHHEAEALQYKRSNVNIEQRRELVARYGGYSIWKWVLPLGSGDPIVELRNSWRVVFVERLSNVSSVTTLAVIFVWS
jgi:hypothetical protein